MRSSILFALLFVTLFLACGTPVEATGDYEWKNLVASGKGCFPPKCAEGQYPMAVLPLVAFDGRLYSIGDDRVWISSNGVDWRSQPKTDWGPRYGMQFAFFNNKLWMLGGMRTWDDFRNDVWSSSDGREWKQVVTKAPWPRRRGHGVIVFKNKIWILGGSISSGRPDQTPTRFLNDVWFSDDGVNWTQATAKAPWKPREDHTAIVFNDKIWVIGGGRGEHIDVWSSDNGKNWALVNANAPWGSRHGNGGAVFDGKMWIYGGIELNDVWSSADGKTWDQVFAHAPWSTRSAYYSVAYKDKLWIFSGKTGREDTQIGDIWAMSRSE